MDSIDAGKRFVWAVAQIHVGRILVLFFGSVNRNRCDRFHNLVHKQRVCKGSLSGIGLPLAYCVRLIGLAWRNTEERWLVPHKMNFLRKDGDRNVFELDCPRCHATGEVGIPIDTVLVIHECGIVFRHDKGYDGCKIPTITTFAK